MPLTFTPSLLPGGSAQKYVYDNLDSDDTNPPDIRLNGTEPAIGSVQITGTFGTNCTIQGSNDGGTTWVTLKDLTGTDMVFTAAGGAEFSTSYERIRPLSTGGGADLDVYFVFRG